MIRLTLVAVLLLSFQGCIFVPFIEGVKEMGVTKSHRLQLLEKSLVNFQSNRGFENLSQVLMLVEESRRDIVKNHLKSRWASHKPVDQRVIDVELSEDGYEAKVDIMARGLNRQTQVVEEQEEMQHWIFEIDSGWKLLEIRAS
jgi:hypothetical protein